ncbi:hypothetical protein OH786_32215 [Streptomyces atratus]|uniref:hypothetical protein n=1 Tax=Streptomyces atratus TaxID=1893 RepID=UPI000930146D|nr:hypothetical protein [Streptomyces atratus]
MSRCSGIPPVLADEVTIRDYHQHVRDQVVPRRHLAGRPEAAVRQVAFIAWAAGAAAGGLVHWFAPEFSDAVSGLAVALIVHVVIERAPARPAAAQTT